MTDRYIEPCIYHEKWRKRPHKSFCWLVEKRDVSLPIADLKRKVGRHFSTICSGITTLSRPHRNRQSVASSQFGVEDGGEA